ncbi:cadherin-23 [Adelges cooleyi]|uniref:cadherin-23 n=1 Tax=Adelges cooleyi TaxID=133065 RepID=UPI00218074EA|nr:cadherin-23 [Adelges cooleyi]
MAYGQWVFLVLLACFGRLQCALNNRPPQFLPGGDMARFSIAEDTAVNKSVYKLLAVDPDGSKVTYTISGQHFSVDRSTGVVTLIKALDRELFDSIEVVISVTDEPIGDTDINTVSLRREIAVVDVNDHPPEFQGRPYSFSVPENAPVGSIIFNNITVIDKDIGINGEITLECIQNSAPCSTFNLLTEKIASGTYSGLIRLARPLDYDSVSSYMLTVKASDNNQRHTLTSTANISVVVKDVQDEPPVFLNSPYSIVIDENTPADVQVLAVNAEDGDAGHKRQVVLSIEDDSLGYFNIENRPNGSAYIYTSENPIDRENKIVSDAGGIYTFRLKATELINNELPGEMSYEIVTVVVQDVDDELPEFNDHSFSTSVSEDTNVGTPLPGLNIVVNDPDLGDNGRYVLVMKSSDPRASNWFKVIPEAAVGRTNVLIRLVDNDGFDYEAGVTNVEFEIVAMYQDKMSGGFKEASSAYVMIEVLDANDNLPKFDQLTYAFSVPENTQPGTKVANLTATDIDSGINSDIAYSLQGFGVDKFGSDSELGGIYLTNKIDYEQQSSYSLTLEAKDGGNRSTHVVILIEVVDVNDNAPVFNALEYRRTIREGATEFQPKLFVQASDSDSGINSMIRYSMAGSNYDGILMVNPSTGELTLNSSVSLSHTSRGQYEATVRATDMGVPALHADVQVHVRVGVPGNQRPVFGNTAYSVAVPENTPRSSQVLRVRATDPDGPDDLIKYSMVNNNDNFHVDDRSGVISVSDRAILDLDVTGVQSYHLVVIAMDSGSPIREVAHADVYVNVTDVNDKPPKFDGDASYIVYVPETTEKNLVVFKVNAVDPDKNASVKYAIVEPIKASDKTGLPLKNSSLYNVKDLFSINRNTGEIKVNNTLSYQTASVIVLTVRAVDENAVENVQQQFDTVEITIFVKPYDNKNPVFTNAGWSAENSSVLVIKIDEETPIGTPLLQLKAVDVSTNNSLYDFKPTTAIPMQITMDYTGKITLIERLDYETIEDKVLTFQVKVTTEDGERSTTKTIVIEIQDINDNAPEFEYPVYRASIVESSPKGTVVLSVRANDEDLPTSQYGQVRYRLGGENANLFTVDPLTGEIKISGNGVVDREKTATLKLTLFASDMPQGGNDQKVSSVPVEIHVKDINDNAPEFDSTTYIAVVLENVIPETSVLNVSARDPDDGPGGLINYKLVDEQQLRGYLYINSVNGQIRTSKRLTGKGRPDPYELKIRAEDNGEPAMSTDVKLSLYISDIIENDGVPSFVHPNADEIAYISENASVGSLVFRALATDPDDPATLEGTIHYSFLEATKDSSAFAINPETGLITTKAVLDRETQDKYTLVLVARDMGDVPQHSTRIFNVIVTDVDDNKPAFNRSVEEKPLVMETEEESAVGTLVGHVKAFDPDIGDNAIIDYIIIDGNEGDAFYLNISDNVAEIRINGEVDREVVSEYLLTVKCFKRKNKAYALDKPYNKQDASERQVLVRIVDVDDNLPKFVQENITIGVRMSVPLDTLVATIRATDVDSSAEQITYHITNLSFSRHTEGSTTDVSTWPFFLDQSSGDIRTTTSMTPFVDGRFTIAVAAINSDVPGRHSNSTIRVYVVKDRGLLKFVFSRPPNVVGHHIQKFKDDVEKALGSSRATLNLYDTQFYSKTDGSLDFSSTGSCFQLVGPNSYSPKDTITLLEDPTNHELKNVYKLYDVKTIERCSPKQTKAAVTWVQLSVLGIAGFIGIASILASCILYCSYKRWKRLR